MVAVVLEHTMAVLLEKHTTKKNVFLWIVNFSEIEKN